jgi:hypothetical protein
MRCSDTGSATGETITRPSFNVVDGGREQQAVLAIEPLAVVAAAPGLDVTRDQVLPAFHPRDAARAFDGVDVVAKPALPAAGLYQRAQWRYPARLSEFRGT